MTDTPAGRNFPYLMEPYIKSFDIFLCPSGERPKVPGKPGQNYAFNGALMTNTDPAVPMSTVAYPAKIVVGNDLGFTYQSGAYNVTYLRPLRFGTGWSYYYVNDSGQAIVHSDGANYVYADGHAKWLKSTLVKSGMWGVYKADGTEGGLEEYNNMVKDLSR